MNRLSLVLSPQDALRMNGDPDRCQTILTEYIRTARRYPKHTVDIQMPNGTLIRTVLT